MIFFNKIYTRTLTEKDNLIKEIQYTKLALESAYSKFENVIDPDLVDSSIFELNAVQVRYKYLIKRIKELT